jgi:hypothetical protein
VNDYTDLCFFFARVNFYTTTGFASWIRPPATIPDWALNDKLPNITTTLDTFANSLYSLLLSDFGVVDQTNAFLTPAGGKWLGNQVDYDLANNSAGFDTNFTGIPNDVQNATDKYGSPYPIDQAYELVVEAIGPPNLNSTANSTIFTQYLCSIPKRKSGGALFFAVLLADLVFLQTVWTLLNVVATWRLQRTNDQDNYCDGCKARGGPLTERKHLSTSSEYQLLEMSP